MSILTTLESIIKLGLPMFGMSWLMFHWLFSEGRLERDAGHRVIRGRLKKIKGTFKKETKGNTRYLYDRWAWFGGGFYGLAGMWTFLVIETQDLYGYLFGGSLLEPFADGFITFIIDFLINQVTNSIQALVWFAYWPGEGQSILIWIAAGYLGYWAGIEMARRNLSPADLVRSNLKSATTDSGEEPNNDNKQPDS